MNDCDVSWNLFASICLFLLALFAWFYFGYKGLKVLCSNFKKLCGIIAAVHFIASMLILLFAGYFSFRVIFNLFATKDSVVLICLSFVTVAFVINYASGLVLLNRLDTADGGKYAVFININEHYVNNSSLLSNNITESILRFVIATCFFLIALIIGGKIDAANMLKNNNIIFNEIVILKKNFTSAYKGCIKNKIENKQGITAEDHENMSLDIYRINISSKIACFLYIVMVIWLFNIKKIINKQKDQLDNSFDIQFFDIQFYWWLHFVIALLGSFVGFFLAYLTRNSNTLWDSGEQIFLGFALCMSGIMIVALILRERKEKKLIKLEKNNNLKKNNKLLNLPTNHFFSP